MLNLKPYWNERYGKWFLWLGVAIAWVGIVLESYNRGRMDWSEMVEETGQITWYLLLFTIFISLLHKLFPKVWQINNIVPMRKYTGILAWIMALTHASSEMLKRGIFGNWSAMTLTAFSTEHMMIAGTISFLIMLPLFLTSTNVAVKVMGYKWWKRLHKLTHVAFVFAGLHVLLVNVGTGEVNFKTAGALICYFVGYAIVFAKMRRKPVQQ